MSYVRNPILWQQFAHQFKENVSNQKSASKQSMIDEGKNKLILMVW